MNRVPKGPKKYTIKDIERIMDEIKGTRPMEVADALLSYIDKEDLGFVAEQRMIRAVYSVTNQNHKVKMGDKIEFNDHETKLYHGGMVGWLVGVYFAVKLLDPSQRFQRREMLNALNVNDEACDSTTFNNFPSKFNCDFTIDQFVKQAYRLPFLSQEEDVRHIQLTCFMDAFLAMVRAITSGPNNWISSN